MRKYKVPIIISIITFIFFFGGLSFAYFFVTKETNTINTIYIGDFNIQFESGNGINLTNTYPMPDGYGQKTKGHQVTINNNSATKACYEVKLSDKYTDTTETYQGNSSLTRTQLRYSVNNLTPNTLPTTNDILYSGILNESENINLNFRLWINETETIETAANKEYYGKLIINTVNCETSPQSTTKNAPTISGDVVYVQEQTIKVINDATFDNGSVAYYEYAITTTDNEPTEQTPKTKVSGSTLKLTEEQMGFISFRAISTHDEISPWSNRVEIKVDTTPPEITIDPETPEKEDYKTIILRFSDDKSGISYYQVTNDNIEPTNWIELTNAQETSATFTATKNGTYYIWTRDKVGNISSQPFTITNIRNSIVVDIVDNMIPVAWSGSELIKADKSNTNNNWYDYDNQKWANAVLVTDASRGNYKSSSQGTKVNENDILAYYTYIPRYRYQLWNTDNNENCLMDNCNEQEIQIRFETKTSEKAIGSTNAEWLTHPAFTFGDSELNGIWVGKFTTSADSSSTCYTSPSSANCNKKDITPRIKPNVDMWRYTQVSTMFSVTKQIETNSMYGLSNESSIDSHMMKNMEWGAVAYLSHSKYGKYGNEDYTGTNKQLYINNYRVDAQAYKTETGCSGGAPSTAQNSSSCPHPYPGLTTEALGASTTGNIYGVYDMSGGVWEYMMGQLAQEGTEIGTFYSNSSSGSWDGIPELKYYDSYEYDTSWLTHGRGHLGDATRETLKTFGTIDTGGWYSDYSRFPNSTGVWFLRGGAAGSGSQAGAFAFDRVTGSAYYNYGFRVLLALE